MNRVRLISWVAVSLAMVLAGPVQAAEWKDLFNGSDLEGWTQVGGTARYRVEGDAIVGYTVPNTPNSFLVTEQNYSPFSFFSCQLW